MDVLSYLLGKSSSGGGGGGSSLDWSAIGYSDTPQSIIADYNYSKDIYDNWDSSQTSLSSKFNGNKNLVYMPLVDTSNATNMNGMFGYCSNLKEIPSIDTSKVVNMGAMFGSCSNLTTVSVLNMKSIEGAYSIQGMFSSCPKLTDTSLDNILQTCIGATLYTGTKTLVRLGIDSTNYPATRIEALPHYQDFIDAGWTIGY